jgi:hypothetical protein
MANSTAQTIPLIEIYDYFLAPGDPATATTSKGKAGRTVKITLQYDKALTIAPDAVVWAAQETVYAALTDGNGFWHVFLIPNNKISPANTYYSVEIEGGLNYQIQVTDVGVPAPGWQSSAPGILLNIPAALAPTTSTVGALTVTGLLTAQAGINITAGGLTVVGGLTLPSGGFTMAGPLTLTAPASQIIPGATSFSVRDTGNANDNLLVTNAGNVTARGSLTVTGGPLTVSAGGYAVTGNSTVTGTLTLTAGLTVSAGGAAITGTSTVTGTLTVSALLTAQAGLTISAGVLTFGASTAQIVPGATSLALRNNANSANNLLLTDAGLATFRNGVLIPAAAAGALAPNSPYSTVPIKWDDQLLAAPATTITFLNPLPTTGFRHILIEWYARGDTGAVNVGVQMRLNNISTATYDNVQVFNNSATTAAAAETLGATSMQVGTIPANSATANYFGIGEAKIWYYNGAVGNKIVSAVSNESLADTTTNQLAHQFTGKWRTTATAVTRVDLIAAAGNFVTGSLFTLWLLP